jgi:hypothetical protein
MLIQMLFTLGLLVGVALAHHEHCPLLVRSAWVLAANFLACNLVAIAAGTHAPVVWLFLIDVVSAIVMLWHPAGRTQAILGAVYVVQLGLHYVFWAAAPAGAAAFYLSMLNVGGGIQIAFLIMGAINGDGRKVHDGGRRSGRRDGVPVPVGAARVEPGGRR